MEELRELTAHLTQQNTPQTEEETAAFLRSVGLEPGTFYQELEMSDRYVETHRDISSSNTTVSLHSHDFYEILYCSNTCGVEYLLGADRYRLQKGDVLIVPPGISHRPLLPPRMSEPYLRDVIWVSREFFDQMLQHTYGRSWNELNHGQLLRTAGTPWEFLEVLFHSGVQESEQRRPGWQLLVLGNTITLLTYLYRATQEETAALPAMEKPLLLDRILAYVEAHLADKLTLAEVARQFYVSQSTVSQTFNNKMGVSFYRCVTQRRLVEAKKLILQGIPLEQVGYRVGFADHSTFYRAFKREYGVSPRQFRKLQEENR